MIFTGKNALAPLYAAGAVEPSEWRYGSASRISQVLKQTMLRDEYFYLAIPEGRKFMLVQHSTEFLWDLVPVGKTEVRRIRYDVYRSRRVGLGEIDIRLQYAV